MSRATLCFLMLARTVSGEELLVAGGTASLVTCRPVSTQPMLRVMLPDPPAGVKWAETSVRVNLENVRVRPFLLRNEREKLILTMKAPYRDLSSLTGYSGDIVIKGVHPNGLTIKSRVPWGSGGMTVAYEGYCDAAELAKAPREFDSFAFVRPLLVTLGFSVLLMVAWLVAPRLIWKDESPVIQSLRKSKRRMGN